VLGGPVDVLPSCSRRSAGCDACLGNRPRPQRSALPMTFSPASRATARDPNAEPSDERPGGRQHRHRGPQGKVRRCRPPFTRSFSASRFRIDLSHKARNCDPAGGSGPRHRSSWRAIRVLRLYDSRYWPSPSLSRLFRRRPLPRARPRHAADLRAADPGRARGRIGDRRAAPARYAGRRREAVRHLVGVQRRRRLSRPCGAEAEMRAKLAGKRVFRRRTSSPPPARSKPPSKAGYVLAARHAAAPKAQSTARGCGLPSSRLYRAHRDQDMPSRCVAHRQSPRVRSVAR